MNHPIPSNAGNLPIKTDTHQHSIPADRKLSATPLVTKTRLPNGLTLVEIDEPLLRTVNISVYIRTGSRFETPEKNGISHFLEHMVFRGTRQYPTAFELNCAFEKLGANVNGSTTPDSTEYSVSLPCQSAITGSTLIFQMVTEPYFNEIDTERKIIAEEILEEFDEKGQCIDVDSLGRQRVWYRSPLGAPITGALENVMHISGEALNDWFNDCYVAANMIVCVSGNIADPEFRTHLRAVWGTVRNGSPQMVRTYSPADAKNAATHFAYVHKPGSQTQLRLTFRTPGLLHPDYPAVELLLRLMDDGMSTPLHRIIFENLALAYNIGAELEAYEDTGVLNIDAQASHENIVPIVTEALQIIADLHNGKIDAGDLEKAKNRTIWDLEAMQDFPGALNAWYGEQELYRESLSPEAAAKRVEKFCATDITSMARHIFQRDNFFITVVGNQSQSQQTKLKNAVMTFAGPDDMERSRG